MCCITCSKRVTLKILVLLSSVGSIRTCVFYQQGARLGAGCLLLMLSLSSGPQLALAKACASGSQLGLEAKACSEIVGQLFQASRAVSKQQVFSVQKGLNDTMR